MYALVAGTNSSLRFSRIHSHPLPSESRSFELYVGRGGTGQRWVLKADFGLVEEGVHTRTYTQQSNRAAREAEAEGRTTHPKPHSNPH